MNARALAVVALAVALASGAARDARADDPGSIARAAAGAGDAAAVGALERRLASWAATSGSRPHDPEGQALRALPESLGAGADALGALVERARRVEAGPELHERLAALAARLTERVAAARDALEKSTAEDEAALEALYRSDAWQQLDYAAATLGYWGGWAQLGRARALPAGAARRAAMQQAVAAFSRSALELRLVGVSSTSLLGLGMAWRDLGELDRARDVLERLRAELAEQPDPELEAACLYELAAVALAQGDTERAGELAARLPEGALSAEQRAALVRAELEGWLRRGDDASLDRAAARLRELQAGGGSGATAAAALAQQHWDRLRGRDLGPAGALLAADDAFDAQRWSEAGAAYASLAASPRSVPGLDARTVRYKLAVCLAQGGERSGAAAALEDVLGEKGAHAARAPAAKLYYQLAEGLLRDEPGPASQARARRASAWLLELAPDAPGADVARYRMATDARGAGAEAAIGELAKIAPESPAYPASRLELARRRAERFQRFEAQGGGAKALASEAQALARDLDAVRALIEQGRLERDPARDATLAVLRAKAALRAGEPAERVRSWVARGAAAPGLDDAGHRALERVSLGVLIATRDFDALAAALAQRSDDALRREWSIWQEALAGAEARGAPPAPLAGGWARLALLAPAEARDAAELAVARALLRAGRADEAAARARALIERDETWGDAWLIHAEALDRAGEAAEAARAWTRVAGGLDRGTPRWHEAQLAAAEADVRAGDVARACRALAALRAAGEAPAALRERVAKLEAECPSAPGAPEDPERAASAPPAQSGKR